MLHSEEMAMELGTFGVILRFAMDLEEQAAGFYEGAARGRLTEAFGELAKGSDKRRKRLERARREMVAEMILESIMGLDGDAYHMDLDPEADEAGLLRQAQALEEASARFYQDAAAKMPIREVVRLFQRLARENEQRKAGLG
ncbi:MAG: ferritin-like domain-containing protein [Anaerolineae bacterium]|nr:ferritin-like domain-containing protein [Anaerolineae bacterium]